MTAEQLIAELKADPAWVAARAERDRELQERSKKLLDEQADLIVDLAAVGVDAKDVWHVNLSTAPNPAAIGVLLAHLDRPYTDLTLDAIARAIGVKSAKSIAWAPMISILKSGRLGGRAGEGVMAAIAIMAKPADLPILIDLISDKSLGQSRALLVRNLTRSRQPEARRILRTLMTDVDLATEISVRLNGQRRR